MDRTKQWGARPDRGRRCQSLDRRGKNENTEFHSWKSKDQVNVLAQLTRQKSKKRPKPVLGQLLGKHFLTALGLEKRPLIPLEVHVGKEVIPLLDQVTKVRARHFVLYIKRE